LVSLNAVRGATVAATILVDNPGAMGRRGIRVTV
jgi:hypothetical protein